MMGHTPQSLRDSSPNLGEQLEIQPVGSNNRDSHSSPPHSGLDPESLRSRIKCGMRGEVAQRAGGVCLPICLLLLLFAFCLSPLQVQAQKYACVNTEYILKNIPDYVTAMSKLGKFTEEWQQELEGKQQELDELRERYQQEAYLLPDNLKQRRQDEIHTKETELRALQHQRFGAGGDLDKKRAELLRPVQDRLYGAIERVAREKNYAFVFDKSQGSAVVYVSEKYDISNQVLEMLGVKPGAAQQSEGGGAASSGKPAAGSKPALGNGSGTNPPSGSAPSSKEDVKKR